MIADECMFLRNKWLIFNFQSINSNVLDVLDQNHFMKMVKGLVLGALSSLFIIGCTKEKEPLPVYGIITWSIANNVFKADSFAVAEKEEIGFNGRPTVTMYGVSSAQNTIQFILDSAGGIGVFIAGNSPQITFNSIQVVYDGKDYYADILHHNTTVTITVTDRTDKKIKGTIKGDLSALSNDKISIDGVFDMNF